MDTGKKPAGIHLSFMKLSTLEPNTDATVNKNIHLLMIGKRDLIHCDQEALTNQFSLVHNIEPSAQKLLLYLVQ